MVEEAGATGWDVLRVDIDVGETQGAVDCGGGEEGEQAYEEEAGEEEQGGEQHRSLEQLSEALLMRRKGSGCEDVEGECKKGVHHISTTDLTLQCVGTDREGHDDVD